MSALEIADWRQKMTDHLVELRHDPLGAVLYGFRWGKDAAAGGADRTGEGFINLVPFHCLTSSAICRKPAITTAQDTEMTKASVTQCR